MRGAGGGRIDSAAWNSCRNWSAGLKRWLGLSSRSLHSRCAWRRIARPACFSKSRCRRTLPRTGRRQSANRAFPASQQPVLGRQPARLWLGRERARLGCGGLLFDRQFGRRPANPAAVEATARRGGTQNFRIHQFGPPICSDHRRRRRSASLSMPSPAIRCVQPARRPLRRRPWTSPRGRPRWPGERAPGRISAWSRASRITSRSARPGPVRRARLAGRFADRDRRP